MATQRFKEVQARVSEIQDRLDAIDSQVANLEAERESLQGELQGLVGKKSAYGFLYTRGGKFSEDHRHRLIKARSLHQACDGMVAFIERYGWEWPDIEVDYEVEHKGTYLDLYKIKHPIEAYLS